MYRNHFGDPKPADLDELEEAFEEVNLDETTGWAEVYFEGSSDIPELRGYYADIRGLSEDGDGVTIITAGFSTLDALVSILEDRGLEYRVNVASGENS